MNMQRTWWWAALMVGCVGGQSGNEGALTDRGCHITSTTAVGWDEQSTLDVSPAEALASVAGSCQATLTWDASGFNTNRVTPVTGATQLSVDVKLDENSARVAESQSEGLTRLYCPTTLEIDAHVRIVSDDGAFDEEGITVVTYTMESGVDRITLEIDANALGGDFSIEAASGETATVIFELAADIEMCAGGLDVMTEQPMGNGAIGLMGGHLGGWSLP